MGERRYSRDCRVPGCRTTLAIWHPHARAHEAEPHVRCACGWIGVSIGRHRGQLKRYGRLFQSLHVQVATVPLPVDST